VLERENRELKQAIERLRNKSRMSVQVGPEYASKF